MAATRPPWLALLLACVYSLPPTAAQAAASPAVLPRDIAAATALCRAKTGVAVESDGAVLCINAEFDVSGKLETSVLSQVYKKRLIVVAKSPGGGLRTALNITRYLEKFDYSIVVDGLCASACAQFLFMGADEKFVTGQGVVAMHGGPILDETIEAMSLTPPQKAALLQESADFRAFYASHKINLSITTDAPKAVLDRLSRGEVVFWAPKREDFKRLGVRNVFFIEADRMKN